MSTPTFMLALLWAIGTLPPPCNVHASDLKEAENQVALGNALTEQGKINEAIVAYRKAIELRPDYAQAHNALGTALRSQGNVVEAVAAYRGALELAPDHAEARKNLAITLGQEQGSLPWGDAVGGVQARLRPKQVKWQATDVPSFELDLRNEGKRPWQGVATQHYCELQVDGKWYKYGANFPGAPSTTLKPGMQVDHWLDVSLGNQWYKAADEKAKPAEEDKPVGKGGPINLAPAKHTVRLAYRLIDTRVDGMPEIRVLTNTVEIEMQAETIDSKDEQPVWGKTLNGLRLGLYVTDPKGNGKPRLTVVLDNTGTEDLVLNLGDSYGKGKKHWLMPLRLNLTDTDGKKRILVLKRAEIDHLIDGPVVAPFVVQLVVGGRYTISRDLSDFFDPKDVDAVLPVGQYQVRAEFVGRALIRSKTDTSPPSLLERMTYWLGTIQSDDIQVRLPAKPANTR